MKQTMSLINHKRVLPMFLLFSMLFDLSAYAAPPPTRLPQTGQKTCYQPKDNTVIACDGSGQDGDTLTGVAWPGERFKDNGDQTVTDKLSGLVWIKDANPTRGYKTWQQALDYIKFMNIKNYQGDNDWRLPNLNELESLVNKQPNLAPWLKSQGFLDVMTDYYWTSTTYATYPNYAWSVSMHSGLVAGRGKADGGYLWPVRSGDSGVLTIAKTGQTVCHDSSGTALPCAGTGQDGELQAGAAWPNPRFTDNTDETVTDRLTGLIWAKEAKAPGPMACNPGTTKAWQEALDYIKCLNAGNYLGKRDWRLPNRNELASLVNHGQANNADWLNKQGFSSVQASSYYSSTTYADVLWNAWSIGMHDGAVTSNAKMRAINVWPVRSGD